MSDFRIGFDKALAGQLSDSIFFRIWLGTETRLAEGARSTFGFNDSQVVLLLELLRTDLESGSVSFDRSDHGGATHQIEASIDDYELADQNWRKSCHWQAQFGRDLYCLAVERSDASEDVIETPDGRKAYETDLTVCRECEVPDGRLLCDAFSHLQMKTMPSTAGIVGGHPDRIHSARCQQGEGAVGRDCHAAGGNSCWHQVVRRTSTAALPSDGRRVLEALDHLDTVWRHLDNGALVKVTSLAEMCDLVGDVESRADFNDHLKRLGELLQKLNVSSRLVDRENRSEGPLQRLKHWVDEHASDASPAVQSLINVNQLRNAVAHTDSGRFRQGLDQLQIPYPPRSWAEPWADICGITEDAIRSITRELKSMADTPRE